MARTLATNFASTLQFPIASAATDLFKKEDVQTLALAVDGHDHSAGKGLTLPASAIGTGLITSAMIADGTITSTDIADGTIATVDIAANAITQVISGTSLTAESTTSATMVAMVAPVVTMTCTGGIVVAFFHGSFNNNGVAGNANNFVGIGIDAVTPPAYQVFVTPGANYAVPTTAVVNFGAVAAGSHTFKPAFATSAGTLTSTAVAARSLVVVEFKR